MKITKYLSILALSAGAYIISACSDDVSPIGPTIADSQVTVYVDSTLYRLNGRVVPAYDIDARSNFNILGHINVPEYGQLSASYVARLMTAGAMEIPDSITVNQVDSMRVIFRVPRTTVVGDTLAPQQLTVYRLNKQLPDDIKSNFNPEGYYDPARPAGHTNYTLSALAYSDSAFNKLQVLPISVSLPREWATDIFTAYRNDPSVFQWPASFNKVFPGIYVQPSFGRGCITAVQAARFYTYWHHTVTRTEVVDGESVKKQVLMKDSVCLMSTAPEVLASNNISFTPSQQLLQAIQNGDKIITTPLGYHVAIQFPLQQLLDRYHEASDELAIINSLSLAIPAKAIDNEYGIGTAPDLLLIRTSEIEDFFANSKVPDNKTSFTSSFDSDEGVYLFNNMRHYIVDMIEKVNNASQEEINDLCDFTLIPVSLTTETSTNADGSKTTYVTGCTPYLNRPTMTALDTEKALIVFTFTHQYID
ncbi:MAG: DUF4270 domain-containing protein [Muribaculaceae bacterium]|nr:DUF4270 domain-containing protein [Muribaculaceae bacterium]